jgi:hypothetical protein
MAEVIANLLGCDIAHSGPVEESAAIVFYPPTHLSTYLEYHNKNLLGSKSYQINRPKLPLLLIKKSEDCRRRFYPKRLKIPLGYTASHTGRQ